MIPKGLSPEETAVYETLIKVVEDRRKAGKGPPKIVVITDLAKDYDDLAAMVVLKELHRLGVIILLGFVANLMPAKSRALFGRGALDSLDLPNIPIAEGTSGFPKKGDKKHEPFEYEFKCGFMAKEDNKSVAEAGRGEDLLKRLFEETVAQGEQLTLLLISSLEDIYTFSQNNPDMLRKAVSNIIMQGGYNFSQEGKLEPDEAAANNRYDIEAAKSFHTFMDESNIPSSVYTKVAAFATLLTSDLFAEMEKTEHPVGQHLRKVQVEQDLAFYRGASNKDPEKRFAPFMDQEWYLRNKTSWFDVEHPPGTPYPEGDEVIPYLTKVVVYDALAGLGTAGKDALDALDVLTDGKVQPPSIHRIVGFAGPPSDPGIHPQQMSTTLSALLKGSLVTCSDFRKTLK
jgi:inosine-uridine nucleoside N-ribohydrolase